MRIPALLALVTGLLAVTPTAQADVINVDVEGAYEYTTIGEGVDAAADGDTVLVHPGLYTGELNRDIDFQGKNIELQSVGGMGATFIDCQSAGRAFSLHSGESQSTVISGFAIQNGWASDGSGGGIRCVGSSPTLRDLWISSCRAEDGAGLYCELHSSPTLQNVSFYANVADSVGGGMACVDHCDAVLSQVYFLENVSHGAPPVGGRQHGGGGMYSHLSSHVLTDVEFHGNTASSGLGGGLLCTNHSTEPQEISLTRVLFVVNVAGHDGGGAFLDRLRATLADVSFLYNSGLFGGGLNIDSSSGATSLTHTVFEGNSSRRGGGGLAGRWSLDPFTIADCSFSSNTAVHDGGALLIGSETVITRTVFSGNEAGERGGGLFSDYSNGLITVADCTFSSNVAATEGGGAWLNSAPASITTSVFSGNQASGRGGGLLVELSNDPITVADCTFSSNVAATEGGGAWLGGVLADITGSVFSGNSAEAAGGMYALSGASNFHIDQCTIVENSAPLDASGLALGGGTFDVENTIIAFGLGERGVSANDLADVTLTCCDIYYNEGGNWVGSIADQYGTNGNISLNPLFCGELDPDDPYGLMADSPCAPWWNPSCGQIGARPVACEAPAVVVVPELIEYVFGPQEWGCQDLVLTNTGDVDLIWEIEVGPMMRGKGGPVAAPSTSEGTAAASRAEPAKDVPVSGNGSPLLRGSGGPDAYGYEWRDSDEPGGPTYDWLDISAFGTPVLLGDDAGQLVILPFTFPFYGQDKHELWICSNGYLTFGGDPSDYSNDPIPDLNDPNDLIAPFWDDLDPTSGGTVHYFYAPDMDRFIVQYTEIPHYALSGTGIYTFQVILAPHGTMLYQYEDMQGDLDSATIGIENLDASVGLEVVYNAPYVHNELAVEIGVPDFWASVTPMSGLVAPGSEQVVEVCASSAGLDPWNIYDGLLTITTNDPYNPEVFVPVSMLVYPTGVEDEAALGDPVLRGIYPNPFNPKTTIAYELPGPVAVSLAIYSISGRHVRTLVDDASQDVGSHTAFWDGTDTSGQRVASGVYMCRLEVDGEVFTKRMVLLK